MMKTKLLILGFMLMYGLGTRAQRNLVLIIADDVGTDYFSSFSNSGDTANTPRIRALAEKGVIYPNTWATPVCSPTRAGIFTGRYSFRTGVGYVIANNTSPQLDTAEVSIARLLKSYAPVAYQTACAGKWHLHANVPLKRNYPNKMGFDFYSGNFNGAITDFYNYPIVVNGMTDTATTYATTQTVNDAISWLDTINATQPFFLWLAFNAAHSPYHLPPANLCDTTGLPGTQAHINANRKLYFKAALQAMDTEIGRLLDYLDAQNQLDSTTIVFIGDNGNAAEVAQIVPVSHSKGTLYDYGVHVPLIVSGPDVVNPGRVQNNLINTHDLFATLAELGGLTNWSGFIPSSTVVDARSFVHTIRNQNGSDRTWIFTEQFHDTLNAADGKSIRDAQFHLIRWDNGQEAFFDVLVDPAENYNLLAGTMSSLETARYHFLCDTLNALVSTGACSPLSTSAFIEEHSAWITNLSAHEMVYIGEGLKQWNLYDMAGALILSGYAKKISLEPISHGIYVIQWMDADNKKYYKKISCE